MRLMYAALVVGIGLVFYLSWVPDPHLSSLWFIPKRLGKWADKTSHGDLRTAVPFVFLGLFGGLLPTRSSNSPVRWFIRWLVLVGVVILAEAGQLLLPHRYFSFEDIGWGALGAFVGLAIAIVLVVLKRKTS
ncbi:hypothetical protein [Spirosoma sp.]|uniref:hypothetical protein n=1 Tax=Spirosoma sp. TaxID=1899569 RepID=UPI003B3A6C75